MPKEVITLSLDEDLITQMKKDAKRDRRNFSNYVNNILRGLYTKKDKKG